MNTPMIQLQGAGKCYRSYERDIDRVLEVLFGKPRHQAFYALQPIDLTVQQGEVIGLIGKNGAGKSTLLKLLAGTVQATSGQVQINGRVSAILELGASFHPDMSGHDNVYLTCAIQGLTRAETAAAYNDIVEFAGIGEFIQRPVKTYSSGMVMRLAFAIATHVNPDILIIDEALSVGDGVFARRSFDRIMEFRKAGKTIFFCSHSLYQVEALCDRVLWLEKGVVRQQGKPASVITAYSEFLEASAAIPLAAQSPVAHLAQMPAGQASPKVLAVEVRVDGHLARVHKVQSAQSTVEVVVRFQSVPGLAVPTLGLIWLSGDGRVISSLGSKQDGVPFSVDSKLQGEVRVQFPTLPLLKGAYSLDVYLLCEDALMVYEWVKQVAEFNVEQAGLELGLFVMPHQWLPSTSSHKQAYHAL
jgi:lipopolysaccharide transport system ATP-binding protein